MAGLLSVAPLVLAILAPDLQLPSPASSATLISEVSPVPTVAAATAALVEPLEALDPELLAAPPEAAPASPGAATLPALPDPAVFREPSLESGQYGVEYELSVRDSSSFSFLGRLSTRFKQLVEQAMTYLGTPYRRGGTSRRGVDCSGLVGAVYGQQGLEMPRTAVQQYAEGAAVAEDDLRPGDLVFFRDTYKRGISHVGIFIGEGRFIHAAGHRRGVVVSELSRPYYHLRFAGARRLAPPATAPAGP
jgi:cell wall-associated NlpC family hydrolase